MYFHCYKSILEGTVRTLYWQYFFIHLSQNKEIKKKAATWHASLLVFWVSRLFAGHWGSFLAHAPEGRTGSGFLLSLPWQCSCPITCSMTGAPIIWLAGTHSQSEQISNECHYTASPVPWDMQVTVGSRAWRLLRGLTCCFSPTEDCSCSVWSVIIC